MKEKAPWSITTTVRNPDRLRDFLLALRELEGEEWNPASQERYQIILIQNRLYGYGNPQFYNGLSSEQIALIDNLSEPISYEVAKGIFEGKGYEDPSMRGRQSINALKKYGFVTTGEGKVLITPLGRILMDEQSDLGDILFRSFLKWQIPNPDSRAYSTDGTYDIKPFIGTLHLIDSVNRKEKELGRKAKGLSKAEFSVFVPTLVNYSDIDHQANRIIDLRDWMEGKTPQDKEATFNDYARGYAREFLDSDDSQKVDKLLKEALIKS